MTVVAPIYACPMTTCTACGAPILWVMTRRNKMQPLDAEPNPEGNVRLRDDWRVGTRGLVQVSEVIPKDEREQTSLLDADDVRYMPHHATCPHADRFRTAS